MERRNVLRITYILNFFVALHTYLTIYVNSNALTHAVSGGVVGPVYITSALLGIGTLLVVPHILRIIGDVRATVTFAVLEILILGTLAFNPHPWLFIVAMVLHLTLVRALQIDSDVFLESASDDVSEGRSRGTFLTIANIALVISPLIVGFLLGETSAYARVYVAALLALVPALVLLLFGFKHFRDMRYERLDILPAIRKAWGVRELRGVFALNFLLRLFYAVMVIYTPLYLHQTIGLPWDKIGIIFTVMLLPFVLLEYPLGRLADTRFGEKEMLIVGFAILSVATVSISFVATTSVLVWTAVLLLTRVGAATVEIMSETYFFKNTGGGDTEIIGLFRIVEPFAYIIATTAVASLLSVMDVRFVFLLLGALMLAGMPISFSLKDTR